MRDSDIEKILADFETAAHEHGTSTESGRWESANVAADTLESIRKELLRRDAIVQLERFLESESNGVRCWAATYTLGQLEKSTLVLEDLAAKTGCFMAISAQTTLDEWRAGKLSFVAPND